MLVLWNTTISTKVLVSVAKQLWIQRGPPGTGAPDLAIVSIETNDPAQTLKEFATSKHSWVVKFREFAKKAYGVDFTGPPPPLNENIVDWQQP
jgi:hypothetical protein